MTDVEQRSKWSLGNFAFWGCMVTVAAFSLYASFGPTFFGQPSVTKMIASLFEQPSAPRSAPVTPEVSTAEADE